jgi:hypothetical protein
MDYSSPTSFRISTSYSFAQMARAPPEWTGKSQERSWMLDELKPTLP